MHPEETVKVECRFNLTDHEIAAAARKRAALEVDLAQLESAFGIEKEKHKNAAAKLEGAAGALGELIRKGYELRPTDCRVEFAYEAGKVRTVRLDTGAVVKSRSMTESEKGKGPRLPLGPAVLLDDSDPDVQAAKAAEKAGLNAEVGGTAQPNIPANNAEAVTQETGTELTPAGDAASPDDLVRELMTGTGDSPAFKAALNEVTQLQLEQAFGYGALSRSAKRAIKGEMAIRGIKPPARTKAEPAKTEGPPVNEETSPGKAEAKDCSSCAHLRIYHEENGCILPECHCPAFTEPGEHPVDHEQAADVSCQCGHAERVHGDTGLRGCMAEGCECHKFRAPLPDPDPLGLDGYPKEEKGEVRP